MMRVARHGAMRSLYAVLVAVSVLYPVFAPCVRGTEYVSRKGFVTLEFSDTPEMHYTHVYPLLESHGFKGSFACITERSQMGIEHDAWMIQEIYLAGHEVQDHTTRHDHMWATHVDTVDDGVTDWIPYTFADVAMWDSLCERSLFIMDSLGIEGVVGWGQPGGGSATTIPGHPGWSWRGSMAGDPNDSLNELISTKYAYGLQGGGPSPLTAHLNLRGHNCPDRFPFFCIPFVTIDRMAAEEIKTDIADAVASGRWFVAQSHVWLIDRVAKVESVVAWLDSTDIEVLKCVDGYERIYFGHPDPLANQFPQARMLEDKDGNGKPDGFTGFCVWDTSTVSPVESTFCISVSGGDADFFCYGPEEGLNSLSMWVKSATPCPGGVRLIWVTLDFEGEVLASAFNTFYPDTLWAKADSSTCNKMVIDVGEEVDRIRFIVRPLDCEPVFVAYPELLLNAQAGVETADRGADALNRMLVRPNPVRWGEIVSITPARNVVLYDVLGRHVLAPKPFHSEDGFFIDTSRLAPGVYFITSRDARQEGSYLVVLR